MNRLVLKKEIITDFAKERNEMLIKSKSEWNLFLDSDEKISKIPKVQNSKQEAYKIKRKNYFLKQYVGDDYLIRLVKKGTGKWVRKVHEYWMPQNGRVGKWLKGHIIHNTADSLSQYLDKMNFYSTLHARANNEEGKKTGLFKIIFLPILKFIYTFLKSKNVVFSIMQSFHSFLSWTKMYLGTDKS